MVQNVMKFILVDPCFRRGMRLMYILNIPHPNDKTCTVIDLSGARKSLELRTIALWKRVKLP